VFKMISDELHVSLEEQKKALEEQLTSDCCRLRRELETTRDEKKEVEMRLENHRKTSGEQIDRQRQGITTVAPIIIVRWYHCTLFVIISIIIYLRTQAVKNHNFASNTNKIKHVKTSVPLDIMTKQH